MNNNIDLTFLISSLSEGHFYDIEQILNWIKKKNEECFTSIEIAPISELKNWIYDENRIHHLSGHFFSIDGIHIETNKGFIPVWEQPIINQPEIGFLGMVTKRFNGILHFLVQAKIEPGNINIVQISPTLQATKSNYTRVHQGKAPLFLEYFNGTKKAKVLIDRLQSEQGGRFLRKRNRNIIIEIDKDEEINVPSDDFIWLTLGQIKSLLAYDNIVNMDTRTVISCISYGSYSRENLDLFYAFNFLNYYNKPVHTSFLYSLLSNEGHINDIRHILNWITQLKFQTDLDVKQIPLRKVRDWIYEDGRVRHINNKYFSVIGVKVSISNREVYSWDQPMIRPEQEGLIAFIVKRINGVYHFLVQAKLEVGNFDLIELAPTVQCLTGNYRKGYNEYTIPYLDEVLNARPEQVWYSSYQSEEGGRFFQEQNLNMIIEVDDNFNESVDKNYCWMTLNQLVSFVGYNNYLNIAARSLLAAIKFD